MAKNNLPAKAYALRAAEGLAQFDIKQKETGSNYMNEMNIAGGVVSKGNYKPEKTDGIKVRGTGAATKGLKARGPMA